MEDSENEIENPRYRELAPRPPEGTLSFGTFNESQENLNSSDNYALIQSYYYYDNIQGGSVKCSACPRAYKPSTRIDTLLRHFSKKHGLILTGGPTKEPERPFLFPISASQRNSMAINHVSTLQIEEAVVRWILEDSLSLSALETLAFTRLISLIAPNTTLPTRSRLRELFNSMLNSANSNNHANSQSQPTYSGSFSSVPVGNKFDYQHNSISKPFNSK